MRRRLALLMLAVAMPASAQHLLVPMDDAQQNHLKAYGLTYNALHDGAKGEWLLNYRGGSFLLPDTPELRRRAALEGITAQPVDDGSARARAQDRHLHAPVRVAVGRRGDHGAPLRGDPV